MIRPLALGDAGQEIEASVSRSVLNLRSGYLVIPGLGGLRMVAPWKAKIPRGPRIPGTGAEETFVCGSVRRLCGSGRGPRGPGR